MATSATGSLNNQSDDLTKLVHIISQLIHLREKDSSEVANFLDWPIEQGVTRLLRTLLSIRSSFDDVDKLLASNLAVTVKEDLLLAQDYIMQLASRRLNGGNIMKIGREACWISEKLLAPAPAPKDEDRFANEVLVQSIEWASKIGNIGAKHE